MSTIGLPKSARRARAMAALLETALAVAPSPPPSIAVLLCVQCGENPRAGRGALSRCIPCIRQAAEQDRITRAAAEATLAALREVPTKACRSCKRTKPVTEFAKHRLAKDGLRHDCRTCVADGTAKRQKPLTPEQREADSARRRQPHRLAANLEAVVSWQARNSDAVEARRAVARAVRLGTLKPSKICQGRGCRARKVEAHHNSYSHRRRLCVVWVCEAHHQQVHAGQRLRLKRGSACRTAFAPETH